MPTIAVLVISKVVLSQSNVMAAFVHIDRILFSDVYPGLSTYKNLNVTQFTITNKLVVQ